MVATRRSLGGQPSPAATSSPPTATPPPPLSRAQQAALKKLDIAGTDALKGDAKAAAAAKAAVQTYHYRGAVYAADANTPSSWIENQPKRYLKRGRGGEDGTAVEGEEDEEDEADEDEDEDDTPARPAKRHCHKPSPRGTVRAGRGGRQSLPAKRKATAIADDDDDKDDDNNMPRKPNWLPENAAERRNRLSQRANPSPAVKPPIPDTKTMDSDNQRRKEEAMRKRYQVQALGEDDLMSEEALARVQLVKLAKMKRLAREKLIEWKMAKELLDIKRKEAGMKYSAHNDHEPSEPNYQSTIDLTHSNSSSQKGNEEELGEQWDREQEANRARNNLPPKPEIPESSPGPERSSNPASAPLSSQNLKTANPFTTAGASRPQTPSSIHPSTLLAGANALPHPGSRGYTPTTTQLTPSTGRSNRSAKTTSHNRIPTVSSPNPAPISTTSPSTTQDQDQDQSFTHLAPDSRLPTISVGGNPLRWTIKRRSNIDAGSGAERAEYAIDVARLEGESKGAKRRRIMRERAVVESWAKLTGGVVREEEGR